MDVVVGGPPLAGEYLLIASRLVPRGVSNIYKGFHRSLALTLTLMESYIMKREGKNETAELLARMTLSQ